MQHNPKYLTLIFVFIYENFLYYADILGARRASSSLTVLLTIVSDTDR